MERPESPVCEQASASVVGPNKSQNGDHVLIRDLDGDLAVMTVADGVGSRPCDWRASEVACEAVMEAISDASSQPAEGVEAGIEHAHWTVGRESGRCEGMLAAIVVAARPRATDEVVKAWVGVAHIYRAYPGHVEQVTEADVETKTIRQDTRTSLPGRSLHLPTRLLDPGTGWRLRS